MRFLNSCSARYSRAVHVNRRARAFKPSAINGLLNTGLAQDRIRDAEPDAKEG